MTTGGEARKALTRSAGAVSIAVMASRVLGLVREAVLAHFFPTALGLDAFTAAYRIPMLARDMFAEGALSKAFVATFAEVDHKQGEEAAWRLASRVTNLLAVIVGIVTLLGIAFASEIVAAIAPGKGFDLPLDPSTSYGFSTKRELTVFLTRVMFPFLPLVALAAVAMGVLNTKGRFGLPALAPAFFNVGSLLVGIAGYFAGPRLGYHPTTGMAVGVVFGGLLQWLIQVPQLRAVGYRWQPELSIRDPWVRQIARTMGPASVSSALVQVSVFASTIFTSFGASWLSWLTVAFRFLYLPIGVFGVAVSTANLPALARAAAAGDTAEFRATISHSLRLILLMTIPASVGLVVLSGPIIRLIYEHGEFTAADTAGAAGALSFYAVGLCGYAAVKVVTDAFYALKDTVTPLKVSSGTLALNIGLNAVAILGLGLDHRAIALSMALTVTLSFVLQFWLLRRRVGGVDGRKIASTAARAAVAAAVMGALVWAVSTGSETWLGVETTLARLAQVGASVGSGVVVFAVLAKVLRLSELDEIFGIFLARFRRG